MAPVNKITQKPDRPDNLKTPKPTIPSRSDHTSGGASRPGTEVLSPEEAAQQDKLLQAVDHIQKIIIRKPLEAALSIGNHLLDTFFDSSYQTFLAQQYTTTTLRQLSAMTDNAVSATYLWQSIQLVEQIRVLPDDLGMQIPISHHRLLFKIQSLREKERLARLIIAEGLSKRALAAAIKGIPLEPITPTPPKSQFVTSLSKLDKIVQNLGDGDNFAHDLQYIDAQDIPALRENTKNLISDLQKLMAKLHQIERQKQRQ